MPEYSYKCNHCKKEFSIFATFAEYQENYKCIFCNKSTSRNYQADLIYTSVVKNDNELTLGHLAHRNSERMSSDEKAHLNYEHNKYKYEEPKKDLPSGMTRLNPPSTHSISTKQRKRDIKKRNVKNES